MKSKIPILKWPSHFLTKILGQIYVHRPIPSERYCKMPMDQMYQKDLYIQLGKWMEFMATEILRSLPEVLTFIGLLQRAQNWLYPRNMFAKMMKLDTWFSHMIILKIT